MRQLTAALLAAAVLAANAQSRTDRQPATGLREALSHYTTLSRTTAWPPLPSPARGLRAGDAYAGALALRQRLTVLGDLADADPAGPDGRLTPVLVGALARFQRRHGLEADGVLGKQTVAALNVPLSQRVRQLEYASQVIDALPHPDGMRAIVVAVPLFRLWAWNGAPWRSTAALDARTIVGAPGTPTPDLTSTIQSITFRPFWTVPLSIAAGELVPAIRKDPDYLGRHGFDIVTRAAGAVPFSLALLPRVISGELQLRQRPGSSNALGLVRFDFPNPHSVFLHDTSARQLFARAGRALSHGCIRVEEPARLAAWVLASAGWDAAAVSGALQGENNRQVPVTDPVRIHVVYVTAMVEADGTVIFGRDLYGRLGLRDDTLSTARALAGSPQC